VPLQVGFNRRFDNGAMATAEASFNAVYGYDIRGEVLARPAWPPPATSAATPRSTTATTAETWRRNIDLFHDAYTAELAHVMDCVRAGVTPEPSSRPAAAARP
jgi:myo-inositol 2-dehydrogenase / D-chiro-inositol 1-dehydrogenase